MTFAGHRRMQSQVLLIQFRACDCHATSTQKELHSTLFLFIKGNRPKSQHYVNARKVEPEFRRIQMGFSVGFITVGLVQNQIAILFPRSHVHSFSHRSENHPFINCWDQFFFLFHWASGGCVCVAVDRHLEIPKRIRLPHISNILCSPNMKMEANKFGCCVVICVLWLRLRDTLERLQWHLNVFGCLLCECTEWPTHTHHSRVCVVSGIYCTSGFAVRTHSTTSVWIDCDPRTSPTNTFRAPGTS